MDTISKCGGQEDAQQLPLPAIAVVAAIVVAVELCCSSWKNR